MSSHPVTNNSCGFEWGRLTVERVTEHRGQLILDVRTDREALVVRITPSGLIRATKTKRRSKRE